LNAKKKVQEKDFKGGLSEIEPALMLMKKNAEANMIGGYCYKELGLFEEAQDCYKTVFDQRPNDPVLLKLMYELYFIIDKKLAKDTLEKMKVIFTKLDK
jgi:Flp pilus assembly protein TadD